SNKYPITKLNKYPITKRNKYPILRIEDLYANLVGGQSYTKLDMSHEYQKLKLDDASLGMSQ
ncbi:hypothetical protein scyTo_0023593, partial [Scyliorhinus torazame]|nr:hypothetical protein [Scyliorhinus torazame]